MSGSRTIMFGGRIVVSDERRTNGGAMLRVKSRGKVISIQVD